MTVPSIADSGKNRPSPLGWLAAGIALTVLCRAIAMLSPALSAYEIESGPRDSPVMGSPFQDLMPTPAFLALYVAAGGLFLTSLVILFRARESRFALAWMLGIGLAMRLAMFGSTPILETDYNRYLWDGAVGAHGMNPWEYSPRAALESGEGAGLVPAPLMALAAEGRETLKRIDHAGLATIYPPVAQTAFAFAYWISPWSVEAWRAVLLMADALTVILLIRLLRRLDRPPVWAALYWWCPLTAVEIFNRGHMDALVLPPLLGALLLCLGGRVIGAMALLGLAAGVKIWPILLAPLLLRHGRRDSVGRRVPGAALLMAIAAAMVGVMFVRREASPSGMLTYAQEWYGNSALYLLLIASIQPVQEKFGYSYDTARWIVRGIPAAILLIWIAWLVRRKTAEPRDLVERSLWIVAGLFLVSPTQFPWYFIWLAPLLACVGLRRSASSALLLYVLLLPFYFVASDFEAVVWLEHVPVWAGMVVLGLMEWRRAALDRQAGPR